MAGAVSFLYGKQCTESEHLLALPWHRWWNAVPDANTPTQREEPPILVAPLAEQLHLGPAPITHVAPRNCSCTSTHLQNEAPSILGNASCWALHMGLSANLRYQVLNGLDMVRSARGEGPCCIAVVCCFRHVLLRIA